MNKLTQLLRRISVSRRIVILILLVSVLPIILAGSFGYIQARSAIYRTAADYNQKLVDVIKQNITLRLQEFVNLSDELILNTTVRSALETYEDMNSTQNTGPCRISTVKCVQSTQGLPISVTSAS